MLPLFLLLSSILILVSTFRLLSILPSRQPRPPRRKRRSTPTHLLIFLGSGGHTAEMLSLLHDLDTTSYTHRTYVISEGDGFSARKASEFERGLAERTRKRRKDRSPGNTKRGQQTVANGEPAQEKTEEQSIQEIQGSYTITTVPRARRIHQPLYTTPFTSLRCLLSCISLLRSFAPSAPSFSSSSSDPQAQQSLATPPPSQSPGYPSLILLNGPGTAVILLLGVLILRFFSFSSSFFPLLTSSSSSPSSSSSSSFPSSSPTPRQNFSPRSIYIESWARVHTLSLSGRIILTLGLCNKVVVQWKGLEERIGVEGGVEYRGVLIR